MSEPLFVTGMLRSGTTLLQTLLNNHPQATVAYQPFNQFLVDVKQQFLVEHGFAPRLPLDSGDPAHKERRDLFNAWLVKRVFSATEAARLFQRAAAGKGGGLEEFTARPPVSSGTFFDLYGALLAQLPREGGKRMRYHGSKEILCEEYVPALAKAGVKCLVLLRDPRAVIASAGHGRYRDQVGDRYPILMMLRLWRKSAGYWLKYRADPAVLCIRYEDLALHPRQSLSVLSGWLELPPFPDALTQSGLKDRQGRAWIGNSSFADKPGIEGGSVGRWREVLDREEARFISACCRHEMALAGYDEPVDLSADDITCYHEDVVGVRKTYLEANRLDSRVLLDEVERFGLQARELDPEGVLARRHFIFPEAMTMTPVSQ